MIIIFVFMKSIKKVFSIDDDKNILFDKINFCFNTWSKLFIIYKNFQKHFFLCQHHTGLAALMQEKNFGSPSDIKKFFGYKKIFSLSRGRPKKIMTCREKKFGVAHCHFQFFKKVEKYFRRMLKIFENVKKHFF